MSGRQLAGVLANITRKARRHGLAGPLESVIETARIGSEQCYRLREKFKELKEFVSSS
jgi:hypothetical protein